MVGFTGLDWAGDSNERKYTLGFMFMLGSGPICWSRKKQATLALSLAEAEYRGAVNVSIKGVWLHVVLNEFGIHTSPSV